MKKVAILQSNYIPWKGYFDIIRQVDEFIIYDDVQYTRRDWRNRNLIKTPHGLLWLTIPVHVKGDFFQKISETKVAETNWNKKHWHSLLTYYAKAPFFKQYQPIFEEAYLNCNFKYLSEINLHFLQIINSILGINTQMSYSADYEVTGNKTERLVHLVKAAGGTHYLSGPAAKDYIDRSIFVKENVYLEWMNYDEYNEYPQMHNPFTHGVTILDLLFNTGNDALDFIKTRTFIPEIILHTDTTSEILKKRYKGL